MLPKGGGGGCKKKRRGRRCGWRGCSISIIRVLCETTTRCVHVVIPPLCCFSVKAEWWSPLWHFHTCKPAEPEHLLFSLLLYNLNTYDCPQCNSEKKYFSPANPQKKCLPESRLKLHRSIFAALLFWFSLTQWRYTQECSFSVSKHFIYH